IAGGRRDRATAANTSSIIALTRSSPLSPDLKGRNWQLFLGIVAMMAISSPQYVWALFTKPLQASLNVGLPALQITFSILIVLQTALSPLQGFLIEKFGPRWLLGLGALFTGASWLL